MGMRSLSQISADQAPLRMSYSMVRAALVASVACTVPPVRFQTSQLSTVPNTRSPASARARAPSTLSRIQAILVDEKYGSSNRPVCSVTVGSKPSALSLLHISEVRRSCQTMALCTGLPVLRSQTSVVSRWLVMPMAAMSSVPTPAFSMAARQVAAVVAQRSDGSCSTQPLSGKCWGNSSCADATMVSVSSNRIARVEVVPWSMARIWVMGRRPSCLLSSRCVGARRRSSARRCLVQAAERLRDPKGAYCQDLMSSS